MLNQIKAKIMNGSYGSDRLVNRSIVLMEQHTLNQRASRGAKLNNHFNLLKICLILLCCIQINGQTETTSNTDVTTDSNTDNGSTVTVTTLPTTDSSTSDLTDSVTRESTVTVTTSTRDTFTGETTTVDAVTRDRNGTSVDSGETTSDYNDTWTTAMPRGNNTETQGLTCDSSVVKRAFLEEAGSILHAVLATSALHKRMACGMLKKFSDNCDDRCVRDRPMQPYLLVFRALSNAFCSLGKKANRGYRNSIF
ncbi:hypothetical protein FSP39_003206 [Pinctada imbricata]|uniref:Uncharacterized protein n=1 Tax=Pinctada imbricata TaxID=66713 RepID=A0AA88XYR5_PINIB|nr:hypothetical protein FSP39_003206 [Pinctada imbricata]